MNEIVLRAAGCEFLAFSRVRANSIVQEKRCESRFRIDPYGCARKTEVSEGMRVIYRPEDERPGVGVSHPEAKCAWG